MIFLKNNGEFHFERWILKPNDVLNKVINDFSSKEFELWIENGQWKTYKLNISEEYVFLVFFFDNVIKFIEVYSKQKESLNETLEKLGGEKKYSWGKVELNVDYKAGYNSIVINFK